VFPEIAKLCRAGGYRFLPIDLRWGVSEQAVTAQRTLPIIFEELARCQHDSPEFFFLLLLGDRYGSRQLPDTIPTNEYRRLLAHLDNAGRTLLAGTYLLDENDVPPAYELRPRSTAPTAAARRHQRPATPCNPVTRAFYTHACCGPASPKRWCWSPTCTSC
jgi:hypothetical protein